MAAVGDLPSLGVTTEVVSQLVPPLPRPTPTRIAVVACAVKIHFPWHKACRRYEEALREVEAVLPAGQFQIVRAAEPFEDPDELLKFVDHELAGGLAGVILFHAAYTAGEIGSHFGRWLVEHGVPVLSWSFPDDQNGTLDANSLCCQNFILGMFRRLGARYAWMHRPTDASARGVLARFGRSTRARDRMKHGRILHIGGSRVTAFYDGELDELAVMRRFGLRFDRIDLQAAFDRARKFADADLQRLRDALVNDPRCGLNAVPDDQIFQSLRLGLTALEMAAERGYIGCTIKSWPELFDQYGCAADGAVSMMNDFGFCTAEEGEMTGVLSSLALHLLSEGRAVPTMMDLSVLDGAADQIGIWHCGACPTRLLKSGTRYETRKHTVLENADPATAVGLMLEFLLELGPATVLRYQSPTAEEWFAFEGELVDAAMPFRGAYAAMAPKPPYTAEQIMGTILDRGLDHHWSLGYGHYLEDLRMLNHWLGANEVPVSNRGGGCGLSC